MLFWASKKKRMVNTVKNRKYQKFYLLSAAGVAAAAAYPVAMGVRVTVEMLRNGAVLMENYPKYVIPYAPIAIALLFGVLLMPVFQKLSNKRGFLLGAALAICAFFSVEYLLETKILIQATEVVSLESWQMSMCYVPPEQYQTRTWEAVDALLGGYSPWFKLHFYLISVVLLLSLLNSFYGYAAMIDTGNESRKKALRIQSAVSLAFLGMCIWACFTAFYRTGEIVVSLASAMLMTVFFVLMGVTVGVFLGSFTLGRKKRLSVLLPSVAAGIMTIAMYVGEALLLSGNLYRFGTGFFFEGLGSLAVAPVDLLVILAAGGSTALICGLLNRSSKN